ncbi:unnamed protein product [Oppiella nova]|uniref:SERTA domain-containing protein n=1 Tax=Oppiella nova TaxID=334625 RepID=A0A7R9QN86_9ACAR|nr:unnamed protein product [Oppiella nova]CAG2169281.1 unnamed protein product [Oppiella nova]
MYFEFESTSSTTESSPMMSSPPTSPLMGPSGGLTRRHRRLSSSSQSLRDLIDAENVLENITPSHCDLYLITRKKLSQMSANQIKQSHDLRREVLLTSIHRTITSKSPPNHSSTQSHSSFNELSIASSTADTPMSTTSASPQAALRDDQSLLNDSTHFGPSVQQMSANCDQMSANCDQQFKFGSHSGTTSTSTTTMANMTSSVTRMTTTSNTTSTPSVIKKRNLSPNPVPSGDYEEEWKTTIKRLKVVHGVDVNAFDVSMDSEFDSGYCDTLDDLTNNFHSLKTPFT